VFAAAVSETSTLDDYVVWRGMKREGGHVVLFAKGNKEMYLLMNIVVTERRSFFDFFSF
jgi:hypothetical protein